MPPKLGILAGGGSLPLKIVEACRNSGRDFLVVAIEGQAEAGALADIPHVSVRLGAAGTAIKHLRDAGCEELVMAGIVHRPSFASLRPDAWGLRFLANTGASHLGDGAFLKTLIGAIEEQEGFRVIGIETLLPDLLARPGAYGHITPDSQALEDIELGIRAALEVGSLDIAQGAVVQQGEVLAVEDEKGTNALLKKVAKQRLEGPGGVLVKVKKPEQEQRVDLPTIGTETVAAAARAGLRGIAVEAGGALVVEADAVIAAADEAGLFVVGIEVPPAADRLAPREDGGDAPLPLIYLIAGEPSGDVLGARLMAALKEKTQGRLAFAGIGGARMEEEGIKSQFPMAELSVMGAAEVLPRLPRILFRLSETVAAIERLRPAAVVTIDSPDFTFRVAKRVKRKGKGIPLIHYVAPSVWAWRPGRARAIAGFLDHLLTLLPFEPPYFEKWGLDSTFVGHPVLESGAGDGDGEAFRKRHGIADGEPLIAVLPGSRAGEVSRLGPVFGSTMFLLKKKHPDLRAVVPTVGDVAAAVRQETAAWAVPVLVVEGERDKFDSFAAADAALAASGTVALELAMARLPSVIAYRLNPITGWIARRLTTARFANLVNLILDREAVPEFLLDACRADFLSHALEDMLIDEDRRKTQIAAYDEALKRLRAGGPSPAARAAKVVLGVLAGAGAEEGEPADR